MFSISICAQTALLDGAGRGFLVAQYRKVFTTIFFSFIYYFAYCFFQNKIVNELPAYCLVASACVGWKFLHYMCLPLSALAWCRHLLGCAAGTELAGGVLVMRTFVLPGEATSCLHAARYEDELLVSIAGWGEG